MGGVEGAATGGIEAAATTAATTEVLNSGEPSSSGLAHEQFQGSVNAGEHFGGGGTGPPPHIFEDLGPFLKRGFELRAVWRRRMCIPQSGI